MEKENAMQDKKEEREKEIKEEKPEVENKSPSMIESAHDAAEKLREQNERMEKNISKLEELKAIETLGGQTNAGEQPESPKEETPEEYKNRIIRGELNEKEKS